MDPEFKRRLLADATATLADLGYIGRQGEDMVVLENTPKVHNLVVCTLCSCYPWPVLGLRPSGTSPRRTARARSSIRAGSCARSGVDLPDDVEVRVWDSTAELRYLVRPSARGDRGGERGRAGRPRHPRRDDRRGSGEGAGASR